MPVPIESLLTETTHATDSCVLFSLLWLAAVDGAPNAKELEFIQEKLSIDDPNDSQTMAMLDIIAANDLESYAFVFGSLSEALSSEERQFLLELAVGIAVVDKKLSSLENHVLQFYADLLGFGLDYLKALYKDLIGSELLNPGDPSSLEWWEKRDSAQRSQRKQTSRSIACAMSASEALQVLGLKAGAGQQEIKKACRRLLQLHHPDRHESIGESARKQAEQKFIQIRQAYEVLRK